MKIDEEGFLKAMQAYLATPMSVEVTTTFPDGRTQTVTTSVGHPVDIRGERPNPMYNYPAQYASDPEVELQRLFGDKYGDGSAIPLDKEKMDAKDFEACRAALTAANRRYDSQKKVWVKKS